MARRRISHSWPAAAAALLMNGCAGMQSALDPAGPQALRISRMWWLMFWVCAAVFVLVMIALALAVWRAPKGEDRTVLKPEAEPGKRRAVTLAVAATVLILFVFLVADIFVGRGLSSLTSPEPVRIKITGHQWWWEVEYDAPMPSMIVTTANEIHIPVGRPIELKTTSTDVIHSFWVPNLHGKKDLIPGYVTTAWMQADRAGVFRGQCAEFCGHQHANMALLVIAEPPEEYEKWLDAQRQPAPQPANAMQQRGMEIFMTTSCAMCHAIQGTPASGSVAPNLTHIASRQTIGAGTLPNTRGHLAGWIVDPQSVKPGNRMPPNPLGAEDLQALLSYLEILK